MAIVVLLAAAGCSFDAAGLGHGDMTGDDSDAGDPTPPPPPPPPTTSADAQTADEPDAADQPDDPGHGGPGGGHDCDPEKEECNPGGGGG